MNPERYRAVRRLFHEAMGLGEETRHAFVRSQPDDDEVKREALALIDAESRAGDGDADPIERALGVVPGMPERVGQFRVLREIGAGAVGTVYEAEQEAPKRRVALKVLRRAGASERLAQRFEMESEVLGRLVHPGIARVYASGVAETPAGARHYIAMEFVDGAPISQWVRDTGTLLDDRLVLMARVCDAVHHAHQRGVIHRDLKPANILVTSDGDPKVLDFGIARAMDDDLASPVGTMQDEVLGTLDYMSPEQAQGGAEGVDVRADVYALGGVLFELVTGERALDTGGMTLASALDAVRASPRRRLRDADRRTNPDLDLIVATALEPDRERRYPSAEAMAADLRRFLRYEPIVARPPTLAYQTSKFVRRHRVGVTAGALVALALVGATVVSLGAAAEAQRERTDAERTLALLTDAIASADPSGGNPADYTLREFLADFATTLDDTDPPPSESAEAQLRGALGSSFIGLGLPEEALAELERAATLRARTLGDDHPDTLNARVLAAVALLDAGRTDEGLERLAALTERCTAALGPSHETTRNAVYFLASAKFKANDPEGAYPLFEALLRANTETYGELHTETVTTMSSLALVLQRLGRFDEALEYNERAAELDVELSGPDDPGALVTRGNLGGLYIRMGRLDDAEAVLIDVLERRRRVLPEQHRHIGVSLSSLALLATTRGAYEEAERWGLAAYEHLDTHQGADHPYTRVARSRLATMYEAWGKPGEAARWRE